MAGRQAERRADRQAHADGTPPEGPAANEVCLPAIPQFHLDLEITTQPLYTSNISPMFLCGGYQCGKRGEREIEGKRVMD